MYVGRVEKLLAFYSAMPMCVINSQGKVTRASHKIVEVFKYDGIVDGDAPGGNCTVSEGRNGHAQNQGQSQEQRKNHRRLRIQDQNKSLLRCRVSAFVHRRHWFLLERSALDTSLAFLE